MERSSLRVVAWMALWLALAALAGAGLTFTVQGSRFERTVHREARDLLGRAGPGPSAPASTEGLPPPVRRYLEAAGATHHAPVRSVRLRHGGTFQPAEDARPLPIRGEQYLVSDPPGFLWWGRIRIAPGLWIDGRDRSVDGAAGMLIRAVSTFTLADASGPELDEGSLQRLLGELVWCPTALLDARWVRWEPVDASRALARLRVGGREVALTWSFGADGLPERVSTVRNRDIHGRYVPTPWLGELRDWREVRGLRVPFRASATWTIDGRPFTYARWEVEALEPDADEPF